MKGYLNRKKACCISFKIMIKQEFPNKLKKFLINEFPGLLLNRRIFLRFYK